MQTAERFSDIKPTNSRWDNGWLISMTSIDGFEMIRYPSERPFVLSRTEWDALPQYRPDKPPHSQIGFFPVGSEVWVLFPNIKVEKTVIETVSIWLDAKGQTISYSFLNWPELTCGRTESECVFACQYDAEEFRNKRIEWMRGSSAT